MILASIITHYLTLWKLWHENLCQKKKKLREIPRCMCPAPEYQKANSPCWLHLEKCEASLRFQWLDPLLCFFDLGLPWYLNLSCLKIFIH